MPTAPSFPLRVALLLGLACPAIPGPPAAADDPRPIPERRWVYLAQNLQVEANADRVASLLRRAAAAGYNGAVLADYKLNILDRVPDFYFRNVERVKAVAEELGIELIPCVFPIGYSSGLLAHDPNLVEPLPVVDAPFVVRGGRAEPDPEAAPRLRNGGFEEARGDAALGFDFQDAAGAGSFLDRRVKAEGGASLRFEDIGAANAPSGNGRIAQSVALEPFRCYRLSVKVKTDGLGAAGSVNVVVLPREGGGRNLSYMSLGVRPTQDWTEHRVIFNSLEHRDVRIYVGVWGGGTGTLWLDDLRLEPVGLLNVVRRDGCPLVVRGEDGTEYEEGRDFLPVSDPQLGAVPYPGEYSIDHDAPSLTLAPGSRIGDGGRLRVSWYHPAFVHEMQAACCLTHPKVYDLLRDQMERVEALFRPSAVFMQHDELRVANWCGLCRGSGETPGALLAENARRCEAIVREVSPEARVYVWSDMFDPFHNATDDYYLVNGTLAGSWEGLSPAVGIVNWYYSAREKNLPFFAERGHEQVLAGYYDGDVAYTADWLESARSRGLPGVSGVMYTTWADRYDDLERFAEATWGGPGR